MRSGGEIMVALDEASKGISAAATELSQLTTSFYEVSEGPEGELILGTGLQFDIALKDELSSIYTDAIENDCRPPAEDIRAAMAERAIQTKRPGLWAEFHTKKARIEALRSWISNQKAAISANQTLMKAERE